MELPEELRRPGEDEVASLRMSLHGTRSAARNWQLQLGQDLRGLGFRQADGSPCAFWHEELDARLVVHGDDLWLQADEVSLAQLLPRLDAEHGGLYDLKSDGVLGPDPGDARQVRSLNKVIRLVPGQGVELEADPRHAEIIPPELGLDRGPSHPVTTPGSKADAGASGAEPRPLTAASEITAYRGFSARGSYLAADTPGLRFCGEGGRACDGCPDDRGRLVLEAGRAVPDRAPPVGPALGLPGGVRGAPALPGGW